MTEAPKRRGRPRGSRNRPKPVEITARPQTATTTRADWTSEEGLAPVPIEEAGYVAPLLENPAIKVVIAWRQAMGDKKTEEYEVDWPANWRLPLPGDTVHLRRDWGGFVNSVDFDLEVGVVRVFLR